MENNNNSCVKNTNNSYDWSYINLSFNPRPVLDSHQIECYIIRTWLNNLINAVFTLNYRRHYYDWLDKLLIIIISFMLSCRHSNFKSEALFPSEKFLVRGSERHVCNSYDILKWQRSTVYFYLKVKDNFFFQWSSNYNIRYVWFNKLKYMCWDIVIPFNVMPYDYDNNN